MSSGGVGVEHVARAANMHERQGHTLNRIERLCDLSESLVEFLLRGKVIVSSEDLVLCQEETL